MKRTTATPLVSLWAIGIVAGFLTEMALTTSGSAVFVPPISLALTLVVVGAIVVGFSIPIRRAVTGASTRRVDPFQAMRIVSLARASSWSGSLFLGLALGAVTFMITRTVLPGVASVWLTAAMALGSALLITAGLIAEHLCRLPKDEDDDPDSAES
ncbi:DUF3180 domain-containing protein [Paramicrobacterium chengjingii]|uniref:DUF3180 domain-containing protein n=1 Tax=Paramicrobacterium chengjingii TaxID=2769067 RepID=A0ABX6YFQ2_9MICO|nr:DUF3180 domain-containing protein [Microbacterium chengjingii]QPZ37619.1 DUF3180 domain-containing protein [Microbacterium chengjingii]